MTFAAGDLISGRYRLEQLIGSGGMGDVFRARDTLLERAVAIKLVDIVDPRRREETTQSFLREARISAAIAHRNVVQILDFGVDNEVVPYIVMELLSGETLAEVLGRGERVPISFIFELAAQVLDGLGAAHDAGVVHRDLKPENIYLVKTRNTLMPKILDFGISKLTDERGSARVTTTQGHVVGTPAYMSPEQARGVKFIDKRTDIYSMGVVLYELLSGEMPFYSENPGDLMVMIVTKSAPPLLEKVPAIPKAISDVVERAMRKKPEERFADAHEMQLALKAASATVRDAAAKVLDQRERPASWRLRPASSSRGGDAVTAEAEATPPGTRHSSIPGRRALVLAGFGALAAASAGIASVWFTRSSPPAPRFIVVQADRPSGEPSGNVDEASPTSVQKEEEAVGPAPARVEKRADAASRVAESFRRQKRSVESCVNRHASEAERSPKLSVQVALEPTGKVERARVLPAEVASGTMGRCIEQAVLAMQFPRLGKSITFDVPLTARKGE